MQQETMKVSLDEIRDGLGQMEAWCRFLHEAVENYDSDLGHAVVSARATRPRPKNQGCPPPPDDD